MQADARAADAWRDGQASGHAHGAASAEEEERIVDACAEVLERYEETPGCEPLYSGYLDLFGNVWACLVAGEGWVDINLVRQDADGAVRASVFRIDAPAPTGLEDGSQ